MKIKQVNDQQSNLVCIDKATEANFLPMQIQDVRWVSLSKILYQPSQSIADSNLFSQTQTLMMINLILSEKLSADSYDTLESRKCVTLHEFTC